MARSTAARTEETLPVASEESSSVATIPASSLPEHLQQFAGQDQGLGYSQKQEDTSIPLIYILQDNSPQVKRRDPAYIEGAEPGDIWLKGINKIVKGKVGIVVQPCAFGKDWVEWVPRGEGGGGGSGFQGRHPDLPRNAKEIMDPKNNNKKHYILPNGNEVVETRYHFVRIDGIPYVIPFTSTGHKVSRDWGTAMQAVKWPDGTLAPSYTRLWRLRTVERSNAAGNWFVFAPEDIGWVTTTADYVAGRDLRIAVETGEKHAEDEFISTADEIDSSPI